MNMEQPTISDTSYQLDLFGGAYRLGSKQSKEVYILAEDFEMLQVLEAKSDNPKDAIENPLYKRVCMSHTLKEAWESVRRNKGSGGSDGETVETFSQAEERNLAKLKEELERETYKPSLIRGKQIPKPNGGVRQLGIPTIRDRIVQQAIKLVIEDYFEPNFSNSSYGFRPNRSAQMAVLQGARHVEDGYKVVVDLDLAKFFDKVNHDILMSRIARKIEDKKILKLIRAFLQAGMMQDGVVLQRNEGTPQGGPLSPLLANILLDELDKELERRGHRFCRYADDCNIYVRTFKAGERVMQSVVAFIEGKLKLKVNREKSKVAHCGECKFLGYTIRESGKLSVSKSSKKQFEVKLNGVLKRNRGRKIQDTINELNRMTTGWINYYRHAQCRDMLKKLDSHIRRKIRCIVLKQCKKPSGIIRFMRSQGVELDACKRIGYSRKGWWRRSFNKEVSRAMPNKWIEETLGYKTMHGNYCSLNGC